MSAAVRGAALILAAWAVLALPVAAQEEPEPADAGGGPAAAPAMPAPPPGPSDAAPAVAEAVEDAPLLTIARDAEGDVTLEGVASGSEAEAGMLAEARRIAGGAVVASHLVIAADALPDGWDARVGEAFVALEEMVSGTASIAPDRLAFEGIAADSPAREAALAALADDRWRASIGIQLDLADPYVFRAEKTDGGLTYSSHAPDEATAAALDSIIDQVAGTGAEGEIRLARGMPGEDWPLLVRAGLVALTTAERGELTIEDREVALTAEVADTGANSRLAEQLGTGWQVDLTIVDPSPAPRLVLTLGPGGLKAEGRLPEALGTEPLTDMLEPLDVSGGLTADAYGAAGLWRAAIDALAIAVPRMREGTIEVADGLARFEGALKEGFSAPDLLGALRATLGPGWQIEVDVGEAPPPSQLEIVRTPDGFDVDGILPDGVEPDALFAGLGTSDTSDLSAGGEGDRWAWRRQLREAARALHVFESGGARIEGSTIRLSGTLQPGYSAADVTEWLEPRLDEGWELVVEAEDRPGRQGDRRAALGREGEEVLRYGHWVPVHDFPVSIDRCDAMLAEEGGGRRITFVPGSSDISAGQGRLLDRLAGVIRRCVTKAELMLEVQGHTDDRGEAEENLLLSEARAIEVVLQLTERGVPAGSLDPVGYGESRPIADNETEAGRARNRRISFAWSE
ncbi:MAG TPA: OmpA family protein [Thermohalobaculum sp.]|nr:OmpA family protein [Thermohalobaculum sp.]